MLDAGFWPQYGEAAKMALGFFWKAGWAFALGYFISALIQAFVPKRRLTPFMGDAGAKSISFASLFGAISSSCSFAALATARALLQKGAHFVAAVAFMFASTNLVIELGILILIFLGWQFLAAEILGGLVLIAVSSTLIRLTFPRRWVERAREKIEAEVESEEENFDWKERIASRRGWGLVGHRFVMEWKMVWEEILIGFTIAGFMAVFVPAEVWAGIFLNDYAETLPGWLLALENAAVAPLVAALTFIGSMGNIPLATVLNANGVLFAGIMGFIYSDLVVPPLVRVNARYYGWRVALYITAVMYASIVATALVLHAVFAWLGKLPEGKKGFHDMTQFAFDYTFWLNLVFAAGAAVLVWLHRRHRQATAGEKEDGSHSGEGGLTLKRTMAYLFAAILAGGMAAFLVTGGTGG